jgi:hypothetical protein
VAEYVISVCRLQLLNVVVARSDAERNIKLVRATPTFSLKSAHAAENKRVEHRTLAKERRKSAELAGNTGVTFFVNFKECGSE